MQSDLPASPAELDAVFRAPNCYFNYPSSHRTTTTICLFEGTPFGALRRFVHVVDGEIRARGGLQIGRDEMTQFFSRHRCFLPSYSNATLRNRVEGMVFGSIAGRKSLRWKRQSMRNSIVGTLYGSLQRLPHLDELPRIAASSMGSTRGGNSSKWSPVTMAGVYVAHLVNAARSHAAATCATTVKNGARLANLFSAKAPADGEAARIYVDAARVIRAEISATGADLCDRRRTDLRALVDPVLERVASGDVEASLDMRTRAHKDATR